MASRFNFDGALFENIIAHTEIIIDQADIS